MSARGDLSYHTAPWSLHGLMICVACRKSITEGDYRVRDTRDAYITHHRACCASDPKWAVLDGEQAAREKHFADLCGAASEFYQKWGVTDLSDYLPDQTPLSMNAEGRR